MESYLDIALIITSIALIISVVLQNKGVGLGGLTGVPMLIGRSDGLIDRHALLPVRRRSRRVLAVLLHFRLRRRTDHYPALPARQARQSLKESCSIPPWAV